MDRTKQIDSKMKICFLALGSYPLLTGKHSTYIGGPDILGVFLAKELQKRDFAVTIITYSDGKTPTEYVDGIEIIKTIPENPSSNIVLRLYLRFRLAISILKALHKAKADIYFQQDGVMGALPLYCKFKRKISVVSIGSDAWVSSWLDWLKGKFSGFGFGFTGRLEYGLDIRLARVVIVMNELQKRLLKKNFLKEGILIKHFVPMLEEGELVKINPPIVIWVGTIVSVKQPEMFLKLAKEIPQARFQMIGGYSPSNKPYFDMIQAYARSIPNCDFLGYVPFGKINKYFQEAAILVNTSKVEGFPHTFLQAWMNRTPVISLNCDPDEIICRNKLGVHSHTFHQLLEDVKHLLSDTELRIEMGNNGRTYIDKEHNISQIVNQYVKIFNGKNAKHIVSK